MDYEKFKDLYITQNINSINFKIKKFQIYLTQYLLQEKKINNYTECLLYFKNEFPNISFLVTEDSFRKIKSDILGKTKNITILELCKSLTLLNKDIIIDSYNISTEYKNKNNNIEVRSQNIIIISNKDMIKYLNYKNGNQYGFDLTYKIVPKSFSPYKLMTLYCIDNDNTKTILAALILLKYKDTNSLLKILSILKSLYGFSPKCITTDFDKAQIKALKQCEAFNQKPYVIPCLFHFSQALVRKLKSLNFGKKKFNKRMIEILRNLEIYCFIKKEKKDEYFKFLKTQINKNENEEKFMDYMHNYWIKKYGDLIDYSELLDDIIKLINYYVNHDGNSSSEKNLISKLKSLDKIYMTNNICETIHSNISKYIEINKVSKNTFRDTLNYILTDYSIKSKNNIRKDYITRNIIYLIEKYELNEKPQLIDYDTFKKELYITIAIMNGDIQINVIKEIASSIEEVDEEDNSNLNNIFNDDEDKIFDKNNYENISEEEDISDSEGEIFNNEDKDKFIDNLSIDFNYENLKNEKDNTKNISNKSRLPDGEDMSVSYTDSINFKENNLNEIIINRGKLNIFTLRPSDYKAGLKKFLLDIDDDLESINAHLANLIFKENNQNKKKQKNKKHK